MAVKFATTDGLCVEKVTVTYGSMTFVMLDGSDYIWFDAPSSSGSSKAFETTLTSTKMCAKDKVYSVAIKTCPAKVSRHSLSSGPFDLTIKGTDSAVTALNQAAISSNGASRVYSHSYCEDVGAINQVFIDHKSSDGWCIENVVVTYKGKSTIFLNSPKWVDQPCTSSKYGSVDCKEALALAPFTSVPSPAPTLNPTLGE
jgi:hypothetical protein